MSTSERQNLAMDFDEWVDAFFEQIHLPAATPVYMCGDGTTYNVSDYIREIKKSAGVQKSFKERIEYEYEKSGRTGVLAMLTTTLPLIMPDMQKDVSIYSFLGGFQW